MQDLIGDWRRWTKVERVIAGVILALVVAGIPTLLAIDSHLFPGMTRWRINWGVVINSVHCREPIGPQLTVAMQPVLPRE